MLPYETNLLELIEKVTNGCQISINKTGTRLIFRPGIIDANDGVEVRHDCNLVRSMTYYLEVICLLGLFGKTELNVTLTGNTDDAKDQSVDSFMRAFNFIVDLCSAPTASIKVIKRGFSPLGGGLVTVKQMYARKIEPVSCTEEGKVKRVRGWVTSAKVSPQLTTRVVDKVRGVFNDFIPDVWIHTDHFKKGQAGEQAGYAVSLQAETTTGVIFTKDFMFDPAVYPMPEDLGERCAQALLDEVFVGGVVDASNQATMLLLAAVSSGDAICQLKLGRVTEQSIALLRNLKRFFNLQFRIEQCEDDVFSSDSEDENQEAEGGNTEGPSEPVIFP